MGKMILFKIFVLTTCVILCRAVNHPNVGPTEFCYDDKTCDPSTWKGTCETGKEQSPINIFTLYRSLKFLETSREFFMNQQYKSEGLHKFYGQNNGHTAQFEFTSNIKALESDLKLTGGDLGDEYTFAQLHFHWGEANGNGSEHTINHERFPMELHLVHFRSNYSSLANALGEDDRKSVAVMAILFYIGIEDNIALEPLVQAVGNLTEPGNITEFHLSLNVSALYPLPGHREYVRYLGSLTTPTCDEKVIWSVFINPVEISQNQIDKFWKLRNSEGISDFNYRPVQPLNGRSLYFFRD